MTVENKTDETRSLQKIEADKIRGAIRKMNQSAVERLVDAVESRKLKVGDTIALTLLKYYQNTTDLDRTDDSRLLWMAEEGISYIAVRKICEIKYGSRGKGLAHIEATFPDRDVSAGGDYYWGHELLDWMSNPSFSDIIKEKEAGERGK